MSKFTEMISRYDYRGFLSLCKRKARGALWYLGEHAFLCILIAILFCVMFGTFLFYKYVFLVRIEYPDTVMAPIKFRKDVYDSVLREWQKREVIFNNASGENYSDPFK